MIRAVADNISEQYSFCVESGSGAARLDKFLSDHIEGHSRARLQALISEGCVQVNGLVCKTPSTKLKPGSNVSCYVPQPIPAEPEAQNIALDIVYEDDDVIVINKPAGLVVHPGAGNQDQTLVNALLYHCGDSLSGIGGVLRPGIVHRLDKETSGLMIAAKHDQAHRGLSEQLKDRTLKRTYRALVFGKPMPLKGEIDFPLGRHAKNRLKMSVQRRGGKDAKTFYHVLKDFYGGISLVECQLDSGRTHQIRVHMEYRKWPILGDPLYGPQRNAVESFLKKTGLDDAEMAPILEMERQMLHAYAIEFMHPVQNKALKFEKSPPDDFSKLLKIFDF